MAKTGTEGSARTDGFEDKFITKLGPYAHRLKGDPTNASAGHTGPGGAKNPKDVRGNKPSLLKKRR